MKFALWILAALPGWILYVCLQAPLMLAGALIVFVLGAADLYEERESNIYPGRKVLAWRYSWAYLWGNEEDGIDGAANGFWSPQPRGSTAEFGQIFAWSAVRNSVGNARWLPFLGIAVVKPIDAIGLSAQTWIARQGARFELHFRWFNTSRAFWLGWKLSSPETPRAGFAFQLFTTFS